MSTTNDVAHTPLEAFLRDVVDQCGGIWEEIEPQVYDVLFPSETRAGELPADDREILRITFDPDAVPEHPGSQLAGFGTPLIEQLLSAAADRGRLARVYVTGLNLNPHGLVAHIERALTLPENATLELRRARPLCFPIGLFWFETTFVSDQKQQEIVPIGFDLHYARQVRHLHRFLECETLADEPDIFLPDGKHASEAEVLGLARQEVIRTIIPLANAHARELNQRVNRQVERMQRYYRDMLAELDELQRRGEQRGTDSEKYARRREALQREERLRVAELRQKSSLHVQLRVANFLLIRQPKLHIEAHLVTPREPDIPLDVVWDPLVEAIEAIPCPSCHAPTFTFTTNRLGRVACPQCRGLV